MQTLQSNNWTEIELRKLRTFAEAGCSAYRIAAALDRTVADVRTIAARQGIVILNFNERETHRSETAAHA